MVAETLNQSLTAYVQHGEKDAFRRNIMDLINVRVAKALELAPADDNGMTLEEAADFIDSLKNDLPVLNPSGHEARRPEPAPTSTSSLESETESQQTSQAPRRRKDAILADEPIPDPVPLRPKRKKK